MFGYVRVKSSELRVKEYEFYRGTYCGLCRSMGACTGQCSRLTLSYDFAFLALLRISLLGDTVGFEQKRCIAHPFKKRNTMKHNPSLAYCAGAAALLNYHKILDDLSDEKGLKRLRARLIYPFVAHSRKKALREGLSDLDRRIAEGLRALSDLEQQGVASVDAPALVFGNILAEIVSYRLPDPEARVAYQLGQTVGKWIYIADALDDWAEDAEKGRYNPFLLLYGGALPTKEELEGIQNALKNELFRAEAAVDLMEFEQQDIREIVLNILYLGMPERIRAMEPGKKTKVGKDKKRKQRESGRKDG